MHLVNGKPFFLVFMAILTSGLFLVTLCSHLCSPNHQDHTLSQSICLGLSHSFGHLDSGQSVFFLLPFTVLFLLFSTHFLPEGIISPPFRPPRFSS